LTYASEEFLSRGIFESMVVATAGSEDLDNFSETGENRCIPWNS
jgi:hypothetical protein